MKKLKAQIAPALMIRISKKDGKPVDKPEAPDIADEMEETPEEEAAEEVAVHGPEGESDEESTGDDAKDHMVALEAIFKKNKVLFDNVKAVDATFFKEMMAKFTEVKNQFNKG